MKENDLIIEESYKILGLGPAAAIQAYATLLPTLSQVDADTLTEKLFEEKIDGIYTDLLTENMRTQNGFVFMKFYVEAVRGNVSQTLLSRYSERIAKESKYKPPIISAFSSFLNDQQNNRDQILTIDPLLMSVEMTEQNYVAHRSYDRPLELLSQILSKKDMITSYVEFLRAFNIANDNTRESNTVDLQDFMQKNCNKIVNLYEILGDNASQLLKNKLFPSAKMLDRFLNNFEEIPVELNSLTENIFQKFQANIKKNDSYFYTFLTQLGLLGMMMNAIDNEDHSAMLEKFNDAAMRANDFSELKDVMDNVILIYFKNTFIPSSDKISVSAIEEFAKSKPEVFHQLLIAVNKMKEHQYHELFKNLILAYLRNDFDSFTTDLTQTNVLGRELALHNQHIRTELKSNNIDIDRAFSQRKSQSFSIQTSKPTISQDTLVVCQEIYRELKSLRESIEKLPSSSLTRTILKNLDALQLNIGDNETNSSRLANDDNIKILRKMMSDAEKLGIPTDQFKAKFNRLDRTHYALQHSIMDILQDMLSNTEDVSLISSIRLLQKQIQKGTEDVSRLNAITNIQALKGIIKKSENSELAELVSSLEQGQKSEIQCHIEQWDKSKIETLLLGKYLSCCLAPERDYFHAMIERTVDSAILMHVVIDDTTNLPICGNWLFFAHDKNNPSDVYVVANFFEFSERYDKSIPNKDPLVDQLAEFTRKYAEEVGAKGFIIRPLTYDKLTSHPWENASNIDISLSKVGPDFKPNNDSNTEYYLEARNINHFHYYPARPPKEERRIPAAYAEKMGSNDLQHASSTPTQEQEQVQTTPRTVGKQ